MEHAGTQLSQTRLALGLLGAFALLLFPAGCSAKDPVEPAPMTVLEMVPVLNQTAEPFDVMPADVLDSLTPETDAESIRYLGIAEGTEYWVGQRQDEPGVCFFISESGVGGSLSGGCIDAQTFYNGGLTNEDVLRGGTLLPSDVDTAQLTDEISERILAVELPSKASSERVAAQQRTRLVTYKPNSTPSVSLMLPRSTGEPLLFNT